MPESLIDLAPLGAGPEEFLPALLEAVAQPIWVVDHNGVIRFANPAAISALGYERADELSGRNGHTTIHSRDEDGTSLSRAECSLLRPLATGETVASGLDWFLRRDGSMFPVSYISVPLEVRGSRVAVVAFTNIEDRLRAEGTLGRPDAGSDTLRDQLGRLAEDQAALRRVATLVAKGVPTSVFVGAVTKEVGQRLGTDGAAMIRYGRDVMTTVGSWTAQAEADAEVGRQWPLDRDSLALQILKTGKPARVDDRPDASERAGDRVRIRLEPSTSVGSPILVEGRVWGNLVVYSTSGALPRETEARLAAFTELVAAAVANSDAQSAVRQLADEQAALRRVATLVAEAVPQGELFDAVVAEVGALFGADLTGMVQFHADDTLTPLATWAAVGEHPPVRGRWSFEGDRLGPAIAKTGRPAREDDWADVPGPIAAFVHGQLGVDSSVGSPVVVEGSVWGALYVHSTHGQPLPAGTEARLMKFTELVATAISNSEARAEVRRLADEQAALRRVATLVAEAVSPSELFGAVTQEVGSLLGADFAGMIRYENDGTVTPEGTWAAAGPHPPVPDSWTTEPGDPATQVFETLQPARIDDWAEVPGPIAAFIREHLGVSSSVGSPIFGQGRLWGALAVHLKGIDPLPADTESRLLNFTQLVATAISNSEARAEVERLAEEQAGLRRVATLVARESPPAEVFAAVGEEVGRLLRVEVTSIMRYEDDGTATVVASSSEEHLRVGDSRLVEGHSVAARVLTTERPARLDDYSEASGDLGTQMREAGIRSAVGAPIVVEGKLWGVTIAATRQNEPLPTGIESRVGEFTELVATTISNIKARADLAASRARIVAATDAERRRVVRDLHDGAQQRLVHTVLTLKLARRALENDEDAGPPLVNEALDHAQQATEELRELAHGILPAALTRGGLRAGVEALASRMPVPIDNAVSAGRLPAAVEATAYFVVAEALTNVAKHAGARSAAVSAHVLDDTLHVTVRDDGVGGVRPGGSGLLGLGDRLAALDGRLRVESPAEGGTLVAADIPLRT